MNKEKPSESDKVSMKTDSFRFCLLLLCISASGYARHETPNDRTSRVIEARRPCDVFSEKILPYLEGCYSAARKCDKEFPGTTTGHVLSECVKMWCYQIKAERMATKCEDEISFYRSSPDQEKVKNPSFTTVHKNSALRVGGTASYALEVSDCP